MSYSGTDQNLNVDLYTRNKGITNPPMGVPKKTSSISTNEWANYASGGDIGSGYGLNTAVSGQQQQLQSWQSQMDSVSDNIVQMAGQFSNSDSLVQSKATQNTQQLLKDKKELTQLKKKIGNMKEVIPNFEQIVDDSNIRLLQENYSYMFWSILAIAIVLITVNMAKRQY
jgi:peptidoglycan hydrolase CwlO-like protein